MQSVSHHHHHHFTGLIYDDNGNVPGFFFRKTGTMGTLASIETFTNCINALSNVELFLIQTFLHLTFILFYFFL